MTRKPKKTNEFKQIDVIEDVSNENETVKILPRIPSNFRPYLKNSIRSVISIPINNIMVSVTRNFLMGNPIEPEEIKNSIYNIQIGKLKLSELIDKIDELDKLIDSL